MGKMRRRRRWLARGLLAALCVVSGWLAVPVVAGGALASAGAARVELAGSVAPVAAGELGVGVVPAGERETVQVWMAGRRAAAERFAAAVSTPGSPGYRRFLSPGAWSQRFGATAAQLDAVRSYLARAGFTQVRASADGDYVSATGSAGVVERAFSTRLRRYRIEGGAGSAETTFEANDRPLSVPPAIRGDVLAVSGLDTLPLRGDAEHAAAPRHAQARECSRYWGQRTYPARPAFRGITRATSSLCRGYSAMRLRAAYGLSARDTGAGATVAVIEVGGPLQMARALSRWARANRLPALRPGQYRQQLVGYGEGRKCLDEGQVESAIDVDAVYAMAPRAKQLLVSGCDHSRTDTQAQFDAELAPLTADAAAPSATIETISYGLGDDRAKLSVPASDSYIDNQIALRAAGEGVSLLVSAGDRAGDAPPDADPDLTVVGGTTLGLGAHGRRLFETGWSNEIVRREGASGAWHAVGVGAGTGGGTSALFAEPSYQDGIVPPALALTAAGYPGRAAPDIAADADPASGMEIGFRSRYSNGGAPEYEPQDEGGTSLSCPLVAGIVADAQGHAGAGFGLLNPLLYSLAGTRAFHDIGSPAASVPRADRATYPGPAPGAFNLLDDQHPDAMDEVTGPGYDTMTGLGTPNGQSFLTALRRERG